MIIWTTIASLISVFADTMLKNAANKNSYLYLTVASLIYVTTAFIWFVIYKTNKFATVNIVYSLSLILLSVLIGVFYFKERLSVNEIIGVILSIVAIFLLSSKA